MAPKWVRKPSLLLEQPVALKTHVLQRGIGGVIPGHGRSLASAEPLAFGTAPSSLNEPSDFVSGPLNNLYASTAVLVCGLWRLIMRAASRHPSRIRSSCRSRTVIVTDTDGAWRMADVIWVDGGARNPKVPTLFQVADVDTGVINWVNADFVTHIVPSV